MRDKFWIIESAIFLALTTGILYAFGQYYDYRLRFEFDFQTIPLGVATETFIHDGATILIAWTGRTIEFWIAIALVLGIVVTIFLLKKIFRTIQVSSVINLSVILSMVIVYASVTHYIPRRAKSIALSLEKQATLQMHSLYLSNGTVVQGYTIISTSSKVAFLSNDRKVYIVSLSDIEGLMVKK